MIRLIPSKGENEGGFNSREDERIEGREGQAVERSKEGLDGRNELWASTLSYHLVLIFEEDKKRGIRS